MQTTEESTGTEIPYTADRLTARTADYARQEPIRAVGIAFAAGLVLTLLPVGAIIAGLVRLAVSLVRPALLILGATKVYDEIQKRQ